jgi:hypothetical protein
LLDPLDHAQAARLNALTIVGHAAFERFTDRNGNAFDRGL